MSGINIKTQWRTRLISSYLIFWKSFTLSQFDLVKVLGFNVAGSHMWTSCKSQALETLLMSYFYNKASVVNTGIVSTPHQRYMETIWINLFELSERVTKEQLHGNN